MKAAVFLEPGKIEIQNLPIPECKDTEVLLKIKSCAVCGTDVRIFQSGQKNVVPPQIIGHEIAGVIEKIGKKVKRNYKIGDKVTVVTCVGCQKCRYCKKEFYNLCDQPRYIGYYFAGGYAEYMIVPQEAVKGNNIIKITSDIDFSEISLIEPLSCCINGQQYLNIQKDDTAVIFGSGPIGCMHSELAKTYGAKNVIMIDISESRLELAKRFSSITHFINSKNTAPVEKVFEITDGNGADVVICAAGANIIQEQALSMISKKGRISFFAGLPKNNPYIKFDSNIVHYKEVSVFGAFASYRKQYEQALQLISSRKVNAKKIITHKFPLDKIIDAINVAKSGEGLKIVVTM